MENKEIKKCPECGEIVELEENQENGLICVNCGEEIKNETVTNNNGLKKTKEKVIIKTNEEKENNKVLQKSKEEKKKAKEGRDEKGRFLEGNKISEGNNGNSDNDGYKEEYNEMIFEYLKEEKDEQVLFHKTKGANSNTYIPMMKVNLPTIERFAKYIGVSRKTIYEWAKKYSEFGDTLDEIKSAQLTRLVNMGLSGDYNPVITKLMLSSNHGMAEKTEQDLNVKNPIRMIVSEMSKEKLDELKNEN